MKSGQQAVNQLRPRKEPNRAHVLVPVTVVSEHPLELELSTAASESH